jgi:hypothetical protein
VRRARDGARDALTSPRLVHVLVSGSCHLIALVGPDDRKLAATRLDAGGGSYWTFDENE